MTSDNQRYSLRLANCIEAAGRENGGAEDEEMEAQEEESGEEDEVFDQVDVEKTSVTLYRAPRDALQKKLRSTMPRICLTGVGAQCA